MIIKTHKKSHRLGPIMAIALFATLWMLPLETNAQEGDRTEPTTTITIARGDHTTITFWANRLWTNSDIVGIAMVPRTRSETTMLLGEVPISLIRYDQASSDGPEVDPMLDLACFSARLADKSYRILGESQAVTSPEGHFEFRNLEAGYYSVQVDWAAVPEGVPFLKAELTYPHRSDFAKPAFSEFTWPESDEAATDSRPDAH